MSKRKWWQETVVYQVYPRSFYDSDNDGIGDLKGIIARLDYLEKLGIGAIWLSPVCRSPQKDNGYDISDYREIDPVFGSLGDMEELIKEADKRNIKILLDLVLNHTSDQHEWFLEAIKSKDNPYHDYYVWRDGEPGEPPNEMKGIFGGSAWEWVPQLGQYYFHQFSLHQPDLNWENPKVRREIYDMILWWMEKGVGGFRLDVIDQIAKEPDRKITINGPRLHEFLQELSRETFQKGDLLTVGEAWGADTELAKRYSDPKGSEFSMVFAFSHMELDKQEGKEKWDLAPLPFLKLKQVLNRWQTELYGCGWNSLFWNNHDLPRIVSRWGNDGKYRVESAKMLGLLLHGMQGTPFIYQGEELGMTNVAYPIEEYRDLETLNVYQERLEQGYRKEQILQSIHAKSRDNARTPMQWEDSEHAGFTNGTPWIKANPNYVTIHAKDQMEDPDSVFHFYRRLVALRKEVDVLVDGKFELLLEDDPHIFAYTRTNEQQKLLVLCNFSEERVQMTNSDLWQGMDLILCNYKCRAEHSGDEDLQLRPYEARLYLSLSRSDIAS